MTINRYDQGDLVNVLGVFTNEDGDVIDPFEVNVSYQTPSGTNVTLTYLTDDEVIRDEPGHYHVDIDASEAGMWRYRWHSTGAGQAASPGQFWVEGLSIVEQPEP